MKSTSKILRFEDLETLRQRNPGKKIVHCHGVFDLFHPGHLRHFQSAKKFGEILVVTLTPDRFVNKGPGRPRYKEDERTSILAALEVVDYVCLNNEPVAIPVIQALKPDFYVKGPDYRDMSRDITGGILLEKQAVEACGGKIVFTDDATDSSTSIINEYFSSLDDSQKSVVENLKKKVGLSSALKEMDEFKNLKVLVVGEPIIDTYVFCKAESISSKSPTVSATQLYEENYTGGSLAIANHLASWGCDVGLLYTHGGEDYATKLLKDGLHENIKQFGMHLPEIPTVRKTRYMVPFRGQRIFELQNLRNDQWQVHRPTKFISQLHDLAPEYDIVLISDFGHGLFEGEVLESLSKIRQFVALNVQTNSANIAFNPFTKHSRYDYLSLDEKECRIGLQDRFSAVDEIAQKTASYFEDRATAVTLGVDGSIYFDEQSDSHRCPVFTKEVVDTTGAGDAFLSITSLLVYTEAPSELVPFLGNCCAGLKSRTIGNKKAVSKVDLVRSVTSLLG